jgi:acetylornithine deacetylase
MSLDPIQLTRRLMDIDSTSGHEAEVSVFLALYLEQMGYNVDRIPVPGEPQRASVFAGETGETPTLVFSTHMDTVPPYIPGSEDADYLYGRGACDAKGIIAAQISAAERLRAAGERVALLFLVGEEKDSIGAKTANNFPRGNRFMINGEPTDNRLARASKGTLRLTLRAHGKMAHSAYPELGDSAIHKLVEVLHDLLALDLPVEPDIGPSTLNVGVINGGHARNVIADEAEAKLLVRLVGPGQPVLELIQRTIAGRVELLTEPENPFIRFRTLPGYPTMVASFATDVPSLPAWGEPLLFGPGSIHVAHTPDERLSKRELHEAVDLYVEVAKRLLHSTPDSL